MLQHCLGLEKKYKCIFPEQELEKKIVLNNLCTIGIILTD